jgi:hypothetical protein
MFASWHLHILSYQGCGDSLRNTRATRTGSIVSSTLWGYSVASLLLLHRLSVRRAMRWQAMGEILFEQIGIVPLSNVWVTPVIALPVSTLPNCHLPHPPRVRKARYVLDPVDKGDLPGG